METSKFLTYAYLELFAAIVILVLFLTGLNRKTKLKKSMLALVITFFFMLLVDSASWLLLGKPEYIVLLKIVWILSYWLLSASIVAFHEYVMSFIENKTTLKRSLFYFGELFATVASLIWLISMFTGWIYRFDATGFYTYTNKGNRLVLEILLGIIVIIDLGIVIKYRKTYGKSNVIAMFSYGVLPLVTIPLSCFFNNSVITMLASSVSILLIYSVSNMSMAADLVRKEQEIKEKNLDLADKQFKLIYSQIQPHFLYNVLNTIYYLVDDDVEKGKKAIVDFSDYMRMNLDSLNKPMLIAFDDELKKTEIYLSLEKLRFEDELNIVYDIQERGFKIPQLTLQPLIENAVKHGICKKKGGGTVTIYTRKFDDYYEIGVTDDGVGFDTSRPFSQERSHIGLSNIIYRVNNLTEGSVEIKSEVGKGTRVIIKLPKEVSL